jgi:hypothetical protein
VGEIDVEVAGNSKTIDHKAYGYPLHQITIRSDGLGYPWKGMMHPTNISDINIVDTSFDSHTIRSKANHLSHNNVHVTDFAHRPPRESDKISRMIQVVNSGLVNSHKPGRPLRVQDSQQSYLKISNE